MLPHGVQSAARHGPFEEASSWPIPLQPPRLDRNRATRSERAPRDDPNELANVVFGRELTEPSRQLRLVVVGSGAGGAVMAATRRSGQARDRRGRGASTSKAERTTTPSRPCESVRPPCSLEAGMLMAFGVGQTPMISITLGRAVGGSSLLTGGVCFRIPSEASSLEHESSAGELSERNYEGVPARSSGGWRSRRCPSRCAPNRRGATCAQPPTSATRSSRYIAILAKIAKGTRAAISPAPRGQSAAWTGATYRARPSVERSCSPMRW